MDLPTPVIYLLPTHLTSDELRQWEDRVASIARVTQVASEADFIVGKISQRLRAQFELRKLKLSAEEASPSVGEPDSTPRAKRRKISSTEDYALRSSSFEDSDNELTQDQKTPPTPARKVIRLAWLQDSLSKGSLLDYRDYLVYTALKEAAAPAPRLYKAVESSTPHSLPHRDQRAPSSAPSNSPSRRRRDGQKHHHKVPPLLPQSTSEEKALADLPPVPEYLHTSYACQRSTVVHPPNEAFIEKLKEVRELRSMKEVRRLPGCDGKIAFLFSEFKDSGELSEIQRTASDQKMTAIKMFTNIFGVSAVTAESFYRRGWRDLDDIVEYGWNTITRSQQIGVKYYEEFLTKIPRKETESIAKTVLQHANRIHEGFQMTIVGGYRRGKLMGGDVDVMLSHRDEEVTHSFIDKLVVSLENDKFITGGTGFDTLDKALVVWQDPRFANTAAGSTNPNPHRRVDILISPWKTVGCAVLGWTSETTFQRDLRRYCKYERNLKFDSSGIRSRKHPYDWVDLEDGGKGPPETMEEAEKRVFEGLGLVFRAPAERCTG
ncbi:hypothetical protein SLS64_006581 [Diaporthe eres]